MDITMAQPAQQDITEHFELLKRMITNRLSRMGMRRGTEMDEKLAEALALFCKRWAGKDRGRLIMWAGEEIRALVQDKDDPVDLKGIPVVYFAKLAALRILAVKSAIAAFRGAKFHPTAGRNCTCVLSPAAAKLRRKELARKGLLHERDRDMGITESAGDDIPMNEVRKTISALRDVTCPKPERAPMELCQEIVNQVPEHLRPLAIGLANGESLPKLAARMGYSLKTLVRRKHELRCAFGAR